MLDTRPRSINVTQNKTRSNAVPFYIVVLILAQTEFVLFSCFIGGFVLDLVSRDLFCSSVRLVVIGGLRLGSCLQTTLHTSGWSIYAMEGNESNESNEGDEGRAVAKVCGGVPFVRRKILKQHTTFLKRLQ